MNFFDEANKVFYLIIFQFKQIFPYWISGVIAGSVLSVYALPKIEYIGGKIKNNVYSLVAILSATMVGVASPLCMYGTVPLIAALGRKGLPQYVLAAFMVSSILLNPNLLLFSFALGVPIVLFRLFSCIAAGFTAGILAKIFFKDRNLFDFKSFAEHQCKYNEKKRFFKDIHKSITITAPYLLIGIVGTALFDRYVPKEAVVTLFGQNRRFGVLLAASLGVPVYVCGGGTIPLLKLWLHQGMTPGSAIAFMLTGPATKLTNLSAVKTILGTFNFIIYILFNFIFSICMGFLANILIGGL